MTYRAGASQITSRFMVALLTVLLLSACGNDSSKAQHLSPIKGLFQGTTEDGQEVVVSLEEVNGNVRLEGQIGGAHFVATASRTVAANGILLDSNGMRTPLRIQLSGSGQRLSIRTTSFGDLTLAPSPGKFENPGSGPFTGKYSANSSDGGLAELVIYQSGDLISGTGTVLGDRVGVAGRIVTPDSAVGHVVYSDGTQVQIRMSLDSANQITVFGFGGHFAMDRQ
ncbi:MAG: hypothetical protein GXP16_12995 [Gammaproteobacteria bacterium]|nr:hypothetical protein [Gammaproteobacteria bacterium]